MSACGAGIKGRPPLEKHTTALAHEYARQGKDWKAELTQRAREKELQRPPGLTGWTVALCLNVLPVIVGQAIRAVQSRQST